jgi:hypothetical protein
MIPEGQHVAAYMQAEAEHGRARGKSFKCFLCGREFISMASLAAHIRSHRQQQKAENQEALTKALERQAAALEAITRELAAIRQTLASLTVVETKMEKRVIAPAPPAEQSPKKQPKTGNLPSFLADNPWVAILSRRGQEP